MSHRWAPLLALGFVSTVWAGGYVGASAAVSPSGGFGPLWLTSSRLMLAGLLLVGLALWRRVPLPPRAALGSIAASGCIAWIGGSGLQTIGQQTVPAGTTAVVLGAGPLVAVALDAAWRRSPPTPRELGWIALGIFGLGLAVGPALSPQAGAASAIGAGLPFVIVACFCWSSASVWESKRPATEGHPLAVAGLQMLVGSAGLVPIALLVGEPLPQPTAAGWAGFAWLGLVCAGMGMPLWFYVLRSLPMSVAMSQATLTPILALCLGVVLLGESLGPRALVGCALVLFAAAAGARDAARLGSQQPPRRTVHALRLPRQLLPRIARPRRL